MPNSMFPHLSIGQRVKLPPMIITEYGVIVVPGLRDYSSTISINDLTQAEFVDALGSSKIDFCTRLGHAIVACVNRGNPALDADAPLLNEAAE